ncbi:MAG: hypothetical protein ABIG20_01790 [archaeon]
MNKYLIVSFVLLMLTPGASALIESQPVLYFGLDICKNDSVGIELFGIRTSEPYAPSDETGLQYKTVIEDNRSNALYVESFDIEFVIFSDPPEPVECAFNSRRVLYNENYSRVVLYKEDEIIFSYDLPVYCNHDESCDESESFLSCPADCPSGSLDNICDRELYDNVCDPDCDPIYDSKDCNVTEEELEEWDKKHNFEYTPERRLPSWLWLGVFVAIVFVIVFGFLKVKKTRKKE